MSAQFTMLQIPHKPTSSNFLSHSKCVSSIEAFVPSWKYLYKNKLLKISSSLYNSYCLRFLWFFENTMESHPGIFEGDLFYCWYRWNVQFWMLKITVLNIFYYHNVGNDRHPESTCYISHLGHVGHLIFYK